MPLSAAAAELLALHRRVRPQVPARDARLRRGRVRRRRRRPPGRALRQRHELARSAAAGRGRRRGSSAITATVPFEDATRGSGLGVPIYGMGAAAADYDNDGRQDVLITAIGQSRLFRNAGDGRFADVTDRAGLGGHSGFSTSALWFDYDRDGDLDLVICNYVRWTPETDVFCSTDGKTKSYCTPAGLSRHDLVAVPQPRQRHLRGRDRGRRPVRSDLEGARRHDARLRRRRLARSVRRQRHAAEQALSQPTQRHVRRNGAAGGARVQRRRPGAGGHGDRCRRLRQQRRAVGGGHELLGRGARPLQPGSPRRLRRSRRRARSSAAPRG